MVEHSFALTQWESGAEFSLVRGSGFTPSDDVEVFEEDSAVRRLEVNNAPRFEPLGW